MFVVTGNRLLDGIVVYLAPEGEWVESLQNAERHADQAVAKSLMASQGEATIVSLDVVPVEVGEDGQVRALRLREQIRAEGPTINPFESIDLARSFASAD